MKPILVVYFARFSSMKGVAQLKETDCVVLSTTTAPYPVPERLPHCFGIPPCAPPLRPPFRKRHTYFIQIAAPFLRLTVSASSSSASTPIVVICTRRCVWSSHPQLPSRCAVRACSSAPSQLYVPITYLLDVTCHSISLILVPLFFT